MWVLSTQTLIYAMISSSPSSSGSKRNNLKMRRPDGGRAKSERSTYDRPVVRKGGSTFEDNSQKDGDRGRERERKRGIGDIGEAGVGGSRKGCHGVTR